MITTNTLILVSLTILILAFVVVIKAKKSVLSPKGAIYDGYKKHSGTIKVLAGIILGWAFGSSMAESESLVQNFDGIVKIVDMFALAITAFYDEIKALIDKSKAVTILLILFYSIGFSQETKWIQIETPIDNPFLEVTKNKGDFETQSLANAWEVVKQLGKLIFSEDIRHSIAKEISPKCKEYEKDLMEDGMKYRELMADYVEALQVKRD